MKTKVDTVCFTLNSVFLIDPKNDDCVEEKDAHGLLCFVVVVVVLRFELHFFPPFLPCFSSFPLSFFSFCTTHLLRLAI